MPKVFIPNKAYHDFSGAAKYGSLEYLTHGKISILAIGRMYRTFLPHIVRSSPDDYILITGPAILSSILCTMFGLRHGVLNLLIYHLDNVGIGHYKSRQISFEDFTNGGFWND